MNEQTRLVPADRWLQGDGGFTLGGLDFQLTDVGPAHSPDDLMVMVPHEGG